MGVFSRLRLIARHHITGHCSDGMAPGKFRSLCDISAVSPGRKLPFMEEVLVIKRCVTCAEMALYRGPSLLQGGFIFCSSACEMLWGAVTPGRWIDASELMPGGRLHDRSDIWAGP